MKKPHEVEKHLDSRGLSRSHLCSKCERYCDRFLKFDAYGHRHKSKYAGRSVTTRNKPHPERVLAGRTCLGARIWSAILRLSGRPFVLCADGELSAFTAHAFQSIVFLSAHFFRVERFAHRLSGWY